MSGMGGVSRGGLTAPLSSPEGRMTERSSRRAQPWAPTEAADDVHDRITDAMGQASALNMQDMMEELSVAVAQSRARRFDAEEEDAAARPAANSVDDALQDLLDMQEELSAEASENGKIAEEGVDDAHAEALTRDRLLKGEAGREDFRRYWEILPDTADERAAEGLTRLAEAFMGEFEDERLGANPQIAVDYVKASLSRYLPEAVKVNVKPDPPLIYAALLFIEGALANARPRRAGALRAVRAAIDSMLLRHQSELRLGLVVANATHEFLSEQMGSAIQARAMYRVEVLRHEGIQRTFENIVRRFGAARFSAAIAFLLDAAAADIATRASGRDAERLKVVRDDIYELATLNTVLRQGEMMLERLRLQYASALGKGADIANVTLFVLRLAENPLAEMASGITGFARTCVTRPAAAVSAFMQTLRTVTLLMPDKIFELEAERRGIDTRGMNPKDHVIEMFDEALELAFEDEQIEMDFGDDEEEPRFRRETVTEAADA